MQIIWMLSSQTEIIKMLSSQTLRHTPVWLRDYSVVSPLPTQIKLR